MKTTETARFGELLADLGQENPLYPIVHSLGYQTRIGPFTRFEAIVAGGDTHVYFYLDAPPPTWMHLYSSRPNGAVLYLRSPLVPDHQRHTCGRIELDNPLGEALEALYPRFQKALDDWFPFRADTLAVPRISSDMRHFRTHDLQQRLGAFDEDGPYAITRHLHLATRWLLHHVPETDYAQFVRDIIDAAGLNHTPDIPFQGTVFHDGVSIEIIGITFIFRKGTGTVTATRDYPIQETITVPHDDGHDDLLDWVRNAPTATPSRFQTHHPGYSWRGHTHFTWAKHWLNRTLTGKDADRVPLLRLIDDLRYAPVSSINICTIPRTQNIAIDIAFKDTAYVLSAMLEQDKPLKVCCEEPVKDKDHPSYKGYRNLLAATLDTP